jgi:hypothetical protein
MERMTILRDGAKVKVPCETVKKDALTSAR